MKMIDNREWIQAKHQNEFKKRKKSGKSCKNDVNKAKACLSGNLKNLKFKINLN
jgi:hypothetical protein